MLRLNDLAGYAQMPGGPKATDGIVIDYRYFGVSPSNPATYNEGKTLTHLIGSYLGLYELWDYRGRCRDDRVADTPIHNSPNFGCRKHNHLSFCTGELTEMLTNFMDNSDDACMDMFTKGQHQRVQAMLSPGGPRHTLIAQTKTQCKNAQDEETILSDIQALSPLDVSRLKLYPNPVKDLLQIDLFINQPILEYQCTILSALGQEMIQLDFGAPFSGQIDQQIDVSDWPAGLYYFKLNSEQGFLSTSFTIQ